MMRYALAVLLLLAAGCDSGGPDDALPDGRFAGTVSGSRDLRLDGQALFSVEEELGSWGLLLLDGSGRVVSADVFRGAPAVGETRVPGAALASLSEYSGTAGDDFEATDGLLTLTSVSDQVVRGALVFEGLSGLGGRVLVETTFAASRLAAPTAARQAAR